MSELDTIQFESLFLQELRDVLPNLRLLSDAMLTKRITQAKLTEISLEYQSLILAGGGGTLTKNELLSLIYLLLKCLVKYLQEKEIVVTLKTLVDHTGYLTAAVDVCFPGYIESKLLGYTVLRPIETVEKIQGKIDAP